MRCTATCIFGVESVLANELKKMGFSDIASENGRVGFNADHEGVVKANMGLRTAERIYIETASFHAENFDRLYDNIKKIRISDYIEKKGRFPVSVTSISSELTSIPAIQSVSKKAVADAMSKQHRVTRPEETGPVYPISVFIYKNNARVYIDTSGSSLYKRGYKAQAGQAPLKETLAAAIVQISYWNKNHILVDPFCGSGTICIEAGMIAKNIAPGLKRDFVSQNWSVYDKGQWDLIKQDFVDAIDNHSNCEILGSDIDPLIIEYAKTNAHNAGVDDIVSFNAMDFKDLKLTADNGTIICNPPYGERLDDYQFADNLFHDMYLKFSEFKKWNKYILAPQDIFLQSYKQKPDKKRKLYNGKIPCDLYQYFGQRGE